MDTPRCVYFQRDISCRETARPVMTATPWTRSQSVTGFGGQDCCGSGSGSADGRPSGPLKRYAIHTSFLWTTAVGGPSLAVLFSPDFTVAGGVARAETSLGHFQQFVKVSSKAVASGTAIVASHYGLELSSKPWHAGRGPQKSRPVAFGLGLLPLAAANCQREEKLTCLLQIQHASRCNSKLAVSIGRRHCLYKISLFKTPQRGMQHSKRIPVVKLKSYQRQSLFDFRDRYARAWRKGKDSQAQHREGLYFGIILRTLLEHLNVLSELADSQINPSFFGKPLLQFLFGGCQRSLMWTKPYYCHV